MIYKMLSNKTKGSIYFLKLSSDKSTQRIFFTLFLLFLVACENPKTTQEIKWEGFWKAKWLISPASPTELPAGKDLFMDGVFIFNQDSLTITAYGFANCVFGEDTLSHTQGWTLQDTSLYLLMPDGTRGIQYNISILSKDQIVLKLLEDITITLSR